MFPEIMRKFTGVALFAAPVVLVKITAMMLNVSGPQTSAAFELETGMNFVLEHQEPPAALTVKQQTLLQLMEEARARPFNASPLLHHEEIEIESLPESLDPEDPENPEAETFEVMISAILSSGHGAVALIDGKPRRVGDTIREEQWRISAIDIDERSVTFVNAADGRVEVRRVLAAP